MIADVHLNEFMDLLSGRLMDGSEDDDETENKVAMFLKNKAKKLVKQQEKEEDAREEGVVSLNQVEEGVNSDEEEKNEEGFQELEERKIHHGQSVYKSVMSEREKDKREKKIYQTLT